MPSEPPAIGVQTSESELIHSVNYFMPVDDPGRVLMLALRQRFINELESLVDAGSATWYRRVVSVLLGIILAPAFHPNEDIGKGVAVVLDVYGLRLVGDWYPSEYGVLVKVTRSPFELVQVCLADTFPDHEFVVGRKFWSGDVS